MLSFKEGEEQTLRVIAKTKYVQMRVTKKGGKLWLNFPYNEYLLGEVKMMEGATWNGYKDPPIKMWTVSDSQRNRFQFEYLLGNNPFGRYDKDHKSFVLPPMEFKPYAHQHESIQFVLMMRYCILAEEMGLGKSLAAIKSMEFSGAKNWWWVAPKSGFKAVQLELIKWKSKVTPELLTYDGVKKALRDWNSGEPPPQGIVFDECQKLKTPTSQRTQAARYVADALREHWGDNGYVVLMSGTPAPKSPADWWSLCEVACPGFLKEGTLQKFVQRLAIMRSEESIAGGKFNRIIGWKDNDNRCIECGKLGDQHFAEEHVFIPCQNEVADLYDRMKGLVLVKFKKDCLDLPEKNYRLEVLRPSLSIANAARMIQQSSSTVVERLIRLRELSDGFQYEEVADGTELCQTCKGERYVGQEGIDACPMCQGTAKQNKTKRISKRVDTPKDPALLNELEAHEDVGRLVVYAAFTESIDRCVNLCITAGWSVIRVDGRGWKMFAAAHESNGVLTGVPYTDPLDMLRDFQAPTDKNFVSQFDQLVFIGHPGSAGVGLTLTASPTIVYFSNDFSAENRIQSEDRIHRPGMDKNRGATIVDFIHLPSDKLVLANLQKKKDLQAITMGDLEAVMNAAN